MILTVSRNATNAFLALDEVLTNMTSDDEMPVYEGYKKSDGEDSGYETMGLCKQTQCRSMIN